MFTFEPFPKIARLKREQIITEKLDGTNAQVTIFELDEDEVDAAVDDPYCTHVLPKQSIVYCNEKPWAMYAGSRKRWIAPEGTDGLPKGCDNFAFARFVADHSYLLFALGLGQHFGEWYGQGIQRRYGLEEKRFALFNVARWGDHNPNTPECCEVVQIVHDDVGNYARDADEAMGFLHEYGSMSVDGFDNPEGIIVYHSGSRTYFKQTFENDGGKWRSE